VEPEAAYEEDYDLLAKELDTCRTAFGEAVRNPRGGPEKELDVNENNTTRIEDPYQSEHDFQDRRIQEDANGGDT